MYMYIVELMGGILIIVLQTQLTVYTWTSGVQVLGQGMWACFSLAVEYKISLLNILYTFGKDEDILIALVSGFICM